MFVKNAEKVLQMIFLSDDKRSALPVELIYIAA